jgi:hypothetical protein
MAEIWPKPTLFYFGPSLYRDNMAKYPKGLFPKNIYNSPLFRKNLGEEQKKGLQYFLTKE